MQCWSGAGFPRKRVLVRKAIHFPQPFEDGRLGRHVFAGADRPQAFTIRYLTIGMPKSDAGHRTIPLPPMVVNTLKEWKLACPKGKDDLVFPNGKGNIEYHANLIKRGLIPTLVRAGVTVPTGEMDKDGKPVLTAKYTGLHALRHWYASWSINRKADGGLELSPKAVQARMGHSSITVTYDTYGHLFPAIDEADALQAAERALIGK